MILWALVGGPFHGFGGTAKPGRVRPELRLAAGNGKVHVYRLTDTAVRKLDREEITVCLFAYAGTEVEVKA